MVWERNGYDRLFDEISSFVKDFCIVMSYFGVWVFQLFIHIYINAPYNKSSL